MNKIIVTINYESLYIESVERHFSNEKELQEMINIINLEGGEVEDCSQPEYYTNVLKTNKNSKSQEVMAGSMCLLEDAYRRKIDLEIAGIGMVATSYSTLFIVDKKGNHKSVSFKFKNEPETKDHFKETKLQLLRKYFYEKQKEKYNISDFMLENCKSSNSVSFNTIEFQPEGKHKGNVFVGKFTVLKDKGYTNLIRIETVEDSYSTLPISPDSYRLLKDMYYIPKKKVLLVQESSIKIMF